MTDDPLEGLRHLFCVYCHGTGVMELVMKDQSREPWPCMHCEAGTRVRESREAAENQSIPRRAEDPETES
jgi:hypothetical protein